MTYEYKVFAMSQFDDQGTGLHDIDKINVFIQQQATAGWELVSIDAEFIVFKRLVV